MHKANTNHNMATSILRCCNILDNLLYLFYQVYDVYLILDFYLLYHLYLLLENLSYFLLYFHFLVILSYFHL